MIVLLFIIISLLLEEGHDYHYQHYLWTISKKPLKYSQRYLY